MISLIFGITAFADKAANTPVTVMTDDFESYVQEKSAAADLVRTKPGRYVAKVTNPEYVEPSEGETTDVSPTIDTTDWYVSLSGGTGWGDGKQIGIVVDPKNSDNNIMAIEGRATYGDWARKPRVIYQNFKVNATDKYTYKFDFYKSTSQTGSGIIFNFSGNNSTALASSNYYAIDF